MIDHTLVRAVRRGLARSGDPEKAAPMQAYMKSALPYRGVQAPEQRRIWREVFWRHPPADASSWRDTALALWRSARYREERYAAIAYTGVRQARVWQTLDTLGMYEEMIVSGRVVGLRRRDRGPPHRSFARPSSLTNAAAASVVEPRRRRVEAPRRDSRAGDIQGAHRPTLLYACIEPSLGDTRFFIRKAIGWALRQHARTDPDGVAAYVHSNASRLSGLSQREALKHISIVR